jgi:hypothetical protein
MESNIAGQLCSIITGGFLLIQGFLLDSSCNG